MRSAAALSLAAAALLSGAGAYAPGKSSSQRSAAFSPETSETQNEGGSGGGRRAFLSSVTAAASLASIGLAAAPSPARALDDDNANLQDVYFGVGCFWHIQHEFTLAERKLLGRGDAELTSRTGYAGGLKTGDGGKVCYHNIQFVADYGKLGHGEAVGMTIPESSVGDFAKEYFSYFTAAGERVDPGDRGGEYRSVLGLPGGTSHPQYSAVEAAASAKGMRLEAGKGNDSDTLGKKLVWVYDTAKFPFYQAEVYHQYHDDFQSPAYGKKYNKLADAAFEDGRLKVTGCPDRVPGQMIGVRDILVSLAALGAVVAAIVAVGFKPRWWSSVAPTTSTSTTYTAVD